MIKIDFENENPTVSGRELHKALEIKTAYKDWFPRMCEYGFTEGKDFATFQSHYPIFLSSTVVVHGIWRQCRLRTEHCVIY